MQGIIEVEINGIDARIGIQLPFQWPITILHLTAHDKTVSREITRPSI